MYWFIASRILPFTFSSELSISNGTIPLGQRTTFLVVALRVCLLMVLVVANGEGGGDDGDGGG